MIATGNHRQQRSAVCAKRNIPAVNPANKAAETALLQSSLEHTMVAETEHPGSSPFWANGG